MADNVVLNSGTGGDTIAADDDGTAKHQYVKVEFGANNTQTPVTAAAPLPVQISDGTDTALVDGSGNLNVTVSGVSGTVSLPTGAATAAKQPALGTAGSASSDVITIQGIASGTVVPVSDGGGALTVDNGGTFAVQADTELTTADLDTGAGTDTRAVVGLVGSKSGGGEIIPGSATDGLLVNLGANNDVTVTGTVTANPASGTVDTVTTVGTITNVVHVDDNSSSLTVDGTVTANLGTIAGVATAAKQPALGTAGTASSDVITIQGIASMTAVKVDASGTAVPVTDNSGSLTVDNGGTFAVQVTPATTGGLSTAMFSGSDGSSILVATAQVVKASAGQLFGYYAYNPEAAVTFVHFYNVAAASVTVGTTNPQMTLAIPAGSAANLMSNIGITFSNAGWSVAATTTAGGNTAPSTGVSLVCWYK